MSENRLQNRYDIVTNKKGDLSPLNRILKGSPQTNCALRCKPSSVYVTNAVP